MAKSLDLDEIRSRVAARKDAAERQNLLDQYCRRDESIDPSVVYLSTKTLAAECGCSTKTVLHYITAGVLKARLLRPDTSRGIGRSWVIHPKDAADFTEWYRRAGARPEVR